MQGKYSYIKPGRQLFFFTLLVLAGLALSGIAMGVVMVGLSNGNTSDVEQIMSNGSMLRVIQLIQTFGMMFLPVLLFFQWFGSKQDVRFFRELSLKNGLVAVVIVLVSQAVISWLAYINYQMQLPQFLDEVQNWMVLKEAEMGRITLAFLDTTQWSIIALNVLIMAVLPAIFEELMFRAIVQHKLTQWWKNPHLAILFSSILFSAIHFQFLTFLPRFFLGGVLGYLFYFGKSIWLPILAHFANNLMALVTFYYMRQTEPEKNPLDIDFNDLPEIWMVAIAVIIIIGGFIYVRKTSTADVSDIKLDSKRE